MQAAYSIYNLTVRTVFGIIKSCRAIASLVAPSRRSNSKVDRFIDNQTVWQDRLAALRPALPGQKTVWFHAASLGEFQIARPIIKKLKNNGSVRIVFTFFSSTAIDALKDTCGTSSTPDIVLALPLDTRRNVRLFLDRLNPDIAVFMVSEFWPNFLNELRNRKIPSLLYSGMFRPKSHTRPGSWFRCKMIACFSRIAVHDASSLKCLQSVGYKNGIRVADPLFDNALAKRDETFHDKIIEKFCEGSDKVLVAGSLHVDRDLDMVASLAEKYPDTRIILVPHEIRRLNAITDAMPGKTVLYSESRNVTDWQNVQCLVIDFIGALAHIYRYGDAAYVGGGFTPLLHSLVEPLVYGIPVAFGPKTGRKYVTAAMLQAGIGSVVASPSELCAWWGDVISGATDPEKIHEQAAKLCALNKGGALKAVRLINKMIKK